MSDEKRYITSKQLRARFGDISEMTLWRWERDLGLGFPRAIEINGRKFYDLADIEAWELTRTGNTRARRA